MKRLLRWLLRFLGVGAFLALIGGILSVTVLPGWVERETLAALRRAGFAEAGLEVRYLGLRGAGISALVLGAEDRFGADQVLLDYRLSDLLDGRVQTVVVAGARWRLSYRDGHLDWAPFGSAVGQGGKGGGGKSSELPFDRVIVRSARLRCEWEEKTVSVALDGEVERQEDGRLGFDLDLALAGVRARVRGATDLSGRAMEFSLRAAVADLAVLADHLPAAVADVPGRPGGRLQLEVEGRRSGGAYVFEARGSGESLSWFGQVKGRPIGARGGSLRLEAARGELAAGDFSLAEARLSFACQEVRYGSCPVMSLALSARHAEGRGAEASVRLQGSGGEVHPLDLTATVRGDPLGAPARPYEIDVAGRLALGRLAELDPALALEGPLLDEGAVARSELALAVMPPGEEGGAWEIEGRGRLDADAEALGVPEFGARLRGLRLRSGLVFSLERSGATFTLAPGGRLVADGVELGPAGTGLEFTGGPREALSLELVEGARLAIRAERGERRLYVSAGELALSTRGLTARTERLEARGMNVELLGALALEGEKATVRALAGSAVRLEDALLVPGVLELTADRGALVEVRVEDALEFGWDAGRPESWRFEGSGVRVKAGATARLPARGVVAEGLAFEGRFGGFGRKDGGEVVLREGGLLGWGAVRTPTPEEGPSLAAGRCHLSGPEGDVRLRLELGDGGPRVRAEVVARFPEALSIEEPKLGTVALDALTIGAGYHADGGGWRTEVTIGGAAVPRLRDGAAGNLAVTWEDALGIEARVVGSGGGAVAEPSWELGIDAATREAKKPLQAKWPGGEVLVGSASLRARATLRGDRPPVLQGEVEIADSEFFHRSAALIVRDVAVTLPFALGAGPAGPGPLSAGTIWLGDDLLPEISGTVGFHDGRLTTTLVWELLEGATLRADGWLLPLESVPRGEVSVDLPEVVFDQDAQPSEILGGLSDCVFEGAASLTARLGIDGPRITPDVNLKLNGVSVRSEVLELAATGIDADLTIDGFAPLASPGAQRIRIERADLGKLRVEDGDITLRLESADSLFIEEAACDWVGGRLHAHAVRLDPAHPDLEFVVYADHLQLDALLGLLAPGEATGRGSLYGRLPLRLDGSKVRYGEAFVYAEPGLGELRILDPKALLGDLPTVAQGALQDFQYSVLKLRFDPIGQKDAILRLRGRSRDPAFPRELILDVNIDGFKALLDSAILVKRMSKGVQGR